MTKDYLALNVSRAKAETPGRRGSCIFSSASSLKVRSVPHTSPFLIEEVLRTEGWGNTQMGLLYSTGRPCSVWPGLSPFPLCLQVGFCYHFCTISFLFHLKFPSTFPHSIHGIYVRFFFFFFFSLSHLLIWTHWKTYLQTYPGVWNWGCLDQLGDFSRSHGEWPPEVQSQRLEENK